jgi:SAM-dependent methyltransferase
MTLRFLDPSTAQALRGRADRSGVLHGPGDAAFPVVGGVPVLVPDPAAWCATHHDAVVATLAAAGLLDDEALALVDEFAAAGHARGDIDAAPFVDDFTPEEARDAPPQKIAHRALADLVDDAIVGGPLAWITAQLGRPRVALELGPGAGALTSFVGDVVGRELWTLDVSLRAVLLAMARGGARTRGVVADACALPFSAGTFDLVVANNVVDVVDAPGALVEQVARVLAPGGRFVLTTPAPDLHGRGGRDDRALENTLRKAGLVVDDVEDGILWPRVHGPRHVELWVCRGVVASRPRSSQRTEPPKKTTKTTKTTKTKTKAISTSTSRR